MPTRGSGYADLMRRVTAADLLQRRPGYCWARIAVTGALLAAGWAGFVLIGDSWWQPAVAAFPAVVFTQVGFVAHDAGHKQMFTSRRAKRHRRDPAREPGRRSGLLVFGDVVDPLVLFVATPPATSAAGPTTDLAAPGPPARPPRPRS